MNPIAPDPIELRAAEPPQATVKVPACVGCGGLPHGSVGAELACLRTTVVAQRERLKDIGGGRGS